MGAIWRKYGAATTILFPLVDAGAVDFESTPVTFAAGDTQISKDEGVFANTGSNPAHEGNGMYSLALTATEMQAARIMVTIIDSATKAWEDQAVLIETYGNASAEHAVDLDDAVRAGLTALPNAAAEAAGGLYTRGTGAGQVNQPANGQIDANVAALANAVITAAKFAAGAIDAAAIGANAIGASEFAQGAADKVWDTVTRILTANTNLNDPTAAAIADQVWDEAKSGHVGAGSFGEEVQSHALESVATEARLSELDAANLPSDVDTLLTRIPDTVSLANIQAEVEAALEDGGQVAVITTIATLASQTSFTLTAGSADDDAYNGGIAVIEDVTTAGQKAYGIISDYVGATRTVTLAVDPGIFVMAATDKISILPPVGVLAWLTAKVNALISGRVDVDVGAKSGNIALSAQEKLDVNAEADTALADYDALVPADLPTNFAAMGIEANGHVHGDLREWLGVAPLALVAQRVSADITAISGDSGAANNLESEYDGTGYKSYIRRGTAQAGAAGSITLDSGASATDDLFNGLIVAILSGTGLGQARLVTDYVGVTKVATITPNWTTNPDATSVFVLWPSARADLALWLGVAMNALVGGAVDANVSGLQANAITASAIAADALTAAKIAANAIGASELATDAVNEIRDAILSDSTAFPGASVTEARLSELDDAAGKLVAVADLIKTAADAIKLETDKLTLGDAGAGVAGSIIEEIENRATPAQVNTEVKDVLETDTHAEPAGVVGATASLKDKINWMATFFRNKLTQTSTVAALRNDGDTANLATAAVSDDGTTATKGEWV